MADIWGMGLTEPLTIQEIGKGTSKQRLVWSVMEPGVPGFWLTATNAAVRWVRKHLTTGGHHFVAIFLFGQM